MRIFLAGGTGVVGRPLVPRLVEEGHLVTAITRRPERISRLQAQGADAVVCDVLDARRLTEIVRAAAPDVVIQHLTDLPPDLNPRNLKKAYERNDKVRGEGSRNLVDAAEAAGAGRFIAQNVCFLYAPVTSPGVVDENAPLWTDAREPFGATIRLHAEMERRITENPKFDGLVLRFGFWYGPGTSFAPDGYTAEQVRRRRYPIVGRGTGMQSFVHMDDVVETTVLALERGDPGVYNVSDDDPAPMHQWLAAYAAALGAPEPRRVPAWLARLVVGPFITGQSLHMPGASNEKAKRGLEWKPKYASWREGFRVALG
ncbi:MAG: NAD(P)-dependent oxidoreductase [Actinomycetota bacterium]|nr:NAD(P)-dependent oxidoreductase [Actinomycetota bacterium]